MSRRAGGTSAFVVGAGRVGTGLARRLPDAGVALLGTWSRSASSAARARRLTSAPASQGRFPDRISDADLVFLAVPDDAIEAVCRGLVEEGLLGRGQAVVHLSGCLDLSPLVAAAEVGAGIGSLHPLAAFADAATAHERFEGALALVDAAPPLDRRLKALARDLGMRAAKLPEGTGRRVLYHAAAVVAAGGLVAVLDLALAIAAAAGLPRREALSGLVHLARGTLENLETLGGTEAALTGPVVRGDAQVVRRHLAALGEVSSEARSVYRALSRRMLDVASRRTDVASTRALALRRVLGVR